MARTLCALVGALLVLLADGGVGLASFARAATLELDASESCCGDVCTCRSASESSCCAAGGAAASLIVAPCGCGHHEDGALCTAPRVPWGLPGLGLPPTPAFDPHRSATFAQLAPDSRRPVPGAPVPRG